MLGDLMEQDISASRMAGIKMIMEWLENRPVLVTAKDKLSSLSRRPPSVSAEEMAITVMLCNPRERRERRERNGNSSDYRIQ
ncbi:hypothetical protein LINGRAHAP2_LOCUS34116 [Linum grandiflorum]